MNYNRTFGLSLTGQEVTNGLESDSEIKYGSISNVVVGKRDSPYRCIHDIGLPTQSVVTMKLLIMRCLCYLWSERPFLIVVLSGLFCLMAIGRYGGLANAPEPRFACATPLFDCGKISADRIIKHKFVIENTGRKPLHILKAVPDCRACMSVNVSQNEVAPSNTSILEVVVDTTRLGKGWFKKTVVVTTDDPKWCQVFFCIQGSVL